MQSSNESKATAGTKASPPLGYLVGDDGRLLFTHKDRAKYARHFAKVGVDIRKIKTKAQFDQAWDKARPYFFEFLADIAKDGDMTRPDRQALLETVKGNQDRARQILARRDRKIKKS